MKIGIPRALLCPIYYPLWETFFTELEHSVVLSSSTNKAILNKGVKSCVEDACLPVKIMHGHVIELIGRCDAIFIPRLISINKQEYICPKFIGIPEMLKNSVDDQPRFLVLDFNARKSIRQGYKGYYKLARKLGASQRTAERALSKAIDKQKCYEENLLGGDNPLSFLDSLKFQPNKIESKGTIGVIGHPYLLYDRYISMDACKKLAARGYKLLFPENIQPEQIEKACSVYSKKLFWSYGKHLLGSGLYMLENNMIDGLVLLTSFACGIDSFVLELLQRRNQRDFKVPLTIITLDEHSGNAGFNTRIEAFIDMMEWRKNDGYHISAYGKSLHIG